MSHQYSEQKIQCTVSDCAHNCLEDSTCRLEKIQVCPCGHKGNAEKQEDTLCGSYHFAGNLNAKEILGGD